MTTRLNAAHRSTLKALVHRVVDVPIEAKAEEAAYQKAESLVRALVEAEFPPADMKILAKYESARRDRCINVRLDAGGDENFTFRNAKRSDNDYADSDSDEHPLVPDTRSCKNRFYLANAKTSAAVSAWRKAEDTRREELAAKISKYETFIDVATTWEQVLETWPEAAQVSDSIVRNLPAAINADTLAEIKRDSTRRLKQAA